MCVMLLANWPYIKLMKQAAAHSTIRMDIAWQPWILLSSPEEKVMVLANVVCVWLWYGTNTDDAYLKQ